MLLVGATMCVDNNTPQLVCVKIFLSDPQSQLELLQTGFLPLPSRAGDERARTADTASRASPTDFTIEANDRQELPPNTAYNFHPTVVSKEQLFSKYQTEPIARRAMPKARETHIYLSRGFAACQGLVKEPSFRRR